uniref:Potassium/proton antiporter CemA n=1 Tax=Ophioglossum hongii TaxID=3238578 RepID=A0AB39U2Z5_9MONI
MRSYWRKLLQWFSNTPYRSLGRAYGASKQMRYIKNNSLSRMDKAWFSRYSWQAMVSYANMEFKNSTFVIYWSLLECKFSIYVLNVWNRWNWIILDKLSRLFSLYHLPFPPNVNSIPSHYWDVLLDLPSFPSLISVFSKIFRSDKFECIEELGRNRNADISSAGLENNSPAPLKRSASRVLNEIDKINRRLAWIEATLNDSEIRKQNYFYSLFTVGRNNQPGENALFPESKDPSVFSVAYESISLVPRSITRTSSRFWAELTGRSGSLIFQESRLAKYQALASLQYIGCLLVFPFVISSLSNRWIVEPWIKFWWNTSQSQIFLNSIQEEEALEKLRELEELLWLDEVTKGSEDIHTQDLGMKFQDKTLELVAIYNEESICLISHISTDIISFATIGFLFVTGRERLAVLNSWIQELFYSLSDTTKAFTILLLTDLCIGFHSPHGWEIVIGYSPEHLGFVHNKYIISCFVSTFPVILDTVFKYWIFRHLNRISPSIVATYHTMNE